MVSHHKAARTLALLFLLGSGGASQAVEYELDPAKGRTLAMAVNDARTGDVYRLAPGYHGTPIIRSGAATAITVVGQRGAIVGRTRLFGASNWVFRDVDFRGVNDPSQGYIGLVTADAASSDLIFERCSIATEEDSSSWSQKEWVDRPYGLGMMLRGPRMQVIKSKFFNLRNAISISNDDTLLQGNTIEAFGNDAIEFSGSRVRIIGNLIRDGRHTPTEKLHADGIQGFPAPKGVVHSDVTISQNRIEASPKGDYLQGITAFDGRWTNVTVQGNRVVTSAYHGITWFGVDGITVEGNEVIQERPGRVIPWIQVTKSKEGRASSAVVVRNNKSPKTLVDAQQ